MRGEGGAFSNANRLRTLGEERHDIKKDRDDVYETKIGGLVCDLKGTDKRLILRAKKHRCLAERTRY